MQNHNNPYEVFPKELFQVTLKHLHPGNSSKSERGNSKYVSHLIVRTKDINGKPYPTAPQFVLTARCSKHDTPSREKAREILTLKAKVVAELKGWRR